MLGKMLGLYIDVTGDSARICRLGGACGSTAHGSAEVFVAGTAGAAAACGAWSSDAVSTAARATAREARPAPRAGG